MKSIREIGNLSLNRINLLGMLQRAFNSRHKKPSPLSPLSLSKSSAPALRGRERQGERLKAHLLFTLYLQEIVYHLFMLFSLFFPSLPLSAPFFSISDFVSVSAHLKIHRRWLLKQTLRTAQISLHCMYLECTITFCACALPMGIQVGAKYTLNIGKSIKS